MKTPIAIVGLGAVLPGARTVEELWDNLRRKRASFRQPSARVGFDAKLYEDLGRRPDRALSFEAGWLTDEWQFDWRSFRVPPADAMAGNKMQFVTLTAGTEALLRVRVVPRQRTAILLGATGLGFQKDGGLRTRADDLRDALRTGPSFEKLDEAVRRDVERALESGFERRVKPSSSDNVVGSLASVAAARIAMHLDLYGAHYAVDADHASSLAALELAVAGLRDGEWDCVLAGGASELLTPSELGAYARADMLSPSGRVAPFSTTADGTLLGEGAALVALKRLDDALRDGDTVYALVHEVGRASSTDGAARPEIIARAMQTALTTAEIAVARVGLVECHASGIPALDRAEAAALSSVFTKPGPLSLSAAKAQLGHLRAAAGAAGLVSAALALHHREQVPWFNSDTRIAELSSDRFATVGESRSWSAGDSRVAGVTSIALDGQAFFAVLESFEAPRHAARVAVAMPAFEFEPLAVVGMGGIYSSAPDLERFWDNLLEGRDEVCEVPTSRWDIARYHSSDAKSPDKSYADKGSFIALPVPEEIDHVPASAIAQLDPTQLLVVRAAEQAFADAGSPRRDPDRVGVFIAFMPFQGRRWTSDARVNARELYDELANALSASGVSPSTATRVLEETERRFAKGLPAINEHSLTGWLGSSAAGRVARRFGFTGPQLAIESACASTLAALHAASQALRERRCDMALVGGAFCDIAPEFYVATSRFNGLSPEGISPFDASAKGFVPGEGAGVLVLRRATDAHEDGQRIRGIVRACFGSSDGKGRSVFTPSVEGESLALQGALAAGRVAGESIGYVECHGTGTAVGDSVEAMALACSYGGADRVVPLRIGSVKSNLGHLIAAAGAPALAKALLVVERGEIPPSLHCERPSPKIDFEEGKLAVVRVRAPWPKTNVPRRAGVSAFGIGGSNFHAIVEEPTPLATGPRVEASPADSTKETPALFAFAGDRLLETVEELSALSAMLAEVSTEDFVEAARGTRERASESKRAARLAIVATAAELEPRAATLVTASAESQSLAPFEAIGLFSAQTPHAGSLAVLFPGQGSQYRGMLSALIAARPTLERVLARADAGWLALTGRALRPSLWPRDGEAPDHEDLHAAVFTVSCALHGLMCQHGIIASLFIGQSAGEISALVAAGVLDFDDGLKAIHARTQAVLALPVSDGGCMAAVACSAERLGGLLAGIAGTVGIAADNCPTSSLASGETPAMVELQRRCKQHGIEYTALEVSHAYHSPVIEAAGARYRATLESLAWRTPRARVLSTVDLEIYDADVARSIERLVRQYTLPVKFQSAIEHAYAQGTRLFFEAGPKWPLTSYVREILGRRPHVANAAIHPKVGEVAQFSRLIACAYVNRVGVLEPGEKAEPAAIASPEATTKPARTGAFEHVRERVVAALAERTGYPSEMLELDLDLEGDLGIDTVKQVEVFARVREELGLGREEGVALRQLNTLRKVIERFAGRIDSGPNVVSADVAPQSSPPVAATPVKAAGPAIATAGSRFEQVRDIVIGTLAERTGYPVVMLELDLDLEGDLGIDTVKQVEVFARVREELGLGREEGVALRQLNTLRKVIERFVARAPDPVAVEGPAGVGPMVAAQRADDALVRYALLGRIVERTATRLVMERTFLPAQDGFLVDSRVAGRACVPASMAWEALAELAEVLLGQPVTQASGLRSAGPLFLAANGRLVVRLEGERNGERVEATLAVAEAAGPFKVRFGAELRTGTPEPIRIPRDVMRALDRRGQIPNAHAVQTSASAVHVGEAMGGAVWARCLSFCELIGGIRAESDSLFERIENPRLVLAPAILECAFLLAGFGWYALARQSGVPVEIERISFGRASEPGEELLCHVRIRSSNGPAVVADVYLLGEDRAPVLQLLGMKLVAVDRIVDMENVESADAVSWARFCRALRDPSGGNT